MSKAFTKEDDRPEAPMLVRLPSASLPAGAKNYLTPDGADRLRKELEHLMEVERPRLAALSEPDDSKRQLVILDQRIRDLQASLQSAVVVLPHEVSEDQVRFGRTVTVREQNGEQSTYRIVGVDETDLDKNWVSYRSPIAKALINGRVGERVKLKLPGREMQLEIVSISDAV
jgi:transcription elongation factor GreB